MASGRKELEARKYQDLHPNEKDYANMVKAELSRKMRKLQSCFEKKETERMAQADTEGLIAHLQSSSCKEKERRPPPKFCIGQSVHHFWAHWMGCADETPKTMHKKARPKWYSALITSKPVWQTGKYGGAEFEGWHYTAH